MDSATDRLGVYRELADSYDRLGQVPMRDRFLILAADASVEAGQPAEAERLRQRLLAGSRYHMLRPYNSFAEAVQAPDVQTYLRDLRTNYPLDIARQLLSSLQPSSNPAVLPFAPLAAPASPSMASDPLPPMAEAVIPPTAPLLDLYGRQGSTPRPTWQPSIPASPGPASGAIPFLNEEVEMTPAPPAHRPLAQPVPPRASTSRSAMPTAPRNASPPAATRAIPLHAPAALPPPPKAEAAEPGSGSWLTYTLVGLVLTAGAALGCFTLARPFLPAGWRF